jgi:uncharacterized membrane protein (DUF373 family)
MSDSVKGPSDASRPPTGDAQPADGHAQSADGDAQPADADGKTRTTPVWMGASVWILEHAQDIVTVVIGVILLLLAAALLISGIVDFATSASAGVANAAQTLLDRALFVLILVEIVHTVVLSLQAHRLIAQPFVVVGLVAVIRRILLVLSSPKPPSTAELALLIGMVAVFIAGLIAVSRYEVRGGEEKEQI